MADSSYGSTQWPARLAAIGAGHGTMMIGGRSRGGTCHPAEWPWCLFSSRVRWRARPGRPVPRLRALAGVHTRWRRGDINDWLGGGTADGES